MKTIRGTNRVTLIKNNVKPFTSVVTIFILACALLINMFTLSEKESKIEVLQTRVDDFRSANFQLVDENTELKNYLSKIEGNSKD